MLRLLLYFFEHSETSDTSEPADITEPALRTNPTMAQDAIHRVPGAIGTQQSPVNDHEDAHSGKSIGSEDQGFTSSQHQVLLKSRAESHFSMNPTLEMPLSWNSRTSPKFMICAIAFKVAAKEKYTQVFAISHKMLLAERNY